MSPASVCGSSLRSNLETDAVDLRGDDLGRLAAVVRAVLMKVPVAGSLEVYRLLPLVASYAVGVALRALRFRRPRCSRRSVLSYSVEMSRLASHTLGSSSLKDLG